MYSKKSVILLFLTAVVSLAIAVSMAFSRSADETLYKQGETYATVYALVRDEYVEEVNSQDLFYGALKGMVEATGDKYSAFLTPAETEEMDHITSGKYVGIGIVIRMRDDGLPEIVMPFRDSPAFRAGIRFGDVIEQADGVALKGLAIEEIKNHISGEAGTKVKLTLRSRGAAESHTVEVERAVIKSDYVTAGFVDKQNKIGYARLVGFSEDSAADLEKVIKEMLGEGMRAFVLDLRDNGGGLLTQAVDISNFFIDSGKIVSIRGRDPRVNKEYDAKGKGARLPQNVPMALLVNGGSASASEVVAGALQDHKRAEVIGEKTFGKNSVQNIVSLEGGCSLKLTVAYYYTPNNRSLKEKLAPDAEVVIDPNKWPEVLEHRNDYEQDHNGEPYAGADDTQLAAAIKYLTEKLSG